MYGVDVNGRADDLVTAVATVVCATTESPSDAKKHAAQAVSGKYLHGDNGAIKGQPLRNPTK